MCRTRADAIPSTSGVQSVGVDSDEATDSEPEGFLGIVHSDAGKTNPPTWNTQISLNNRNVVFKIDTGADVTVIPDTYYCPQIDGPLQPSQRILMGAGQQPLTVQGRVSRNGSEANQDIHVYLLLKDYANPSWAAQLLTH